MIELSNTCFFCLIVIVLVMKRGRVLAVVVGGVFCLAVMSLYRMLEMMQGAEPDHGRDGPYKQVDEVRYRIHFLFCFCLFQN